mgnify:CR=1 FL=1
MTKHTKEELALVREWLQERYQEAICQNPAFANDVSEADYCRANVNAVLTFDRRMQLLRAGRGDIRNAWSIEAIDVIGF